MTGRVRLAAIGIVSALTVSSAGWAADPDSCKAVRFSDVGWTDITSTTAATSVVLTGLGYEPSATVLSVPVTYTSLKNGDIDVFLGNWMPTMEADIAPYREDGSVETLGMNLTGAKYTLAVNKAAADGGIGKFGDIAGHRDMLDGKIYGIEPGNDGKPADPEHDRRGRLRPEGLRGGRVQRAGHAGPGCPRQPEGRVDGLPRLGAAPDERQFRARISRWRR